MKKKHELHQINVKNYTHTHTYSHKFKGINNLYKAKSRSEISMCLHS